MSEKTMKKLIINDNDFVIYDAEARSQLAGKQDALTAGSGISIQRTGATEKELESETLPVTIVASGDALADYKIYGAMTQNGTPSPDNPVDVSGVGSTFKIKANDIETDVILATPLYKIGDYVDRIEYAAKKAYRNVKTQNLSHLSWTASTAGGKYRFSATLSDYAPDVSAGRATNAYFNRFVYGSTDAYGIGFGHANKSIYIYVSDSITTVAQLQAWLNDNEAYVVYPVSTEYTEEIDPPAVRPAKGSNSIDVISTAKASKLYLKYMQGSASEEVILSVADSYINDLIDTKLGVIEDGSY